MSTLVLPVNMSELLLEKGYIEIAISCVAAPQVCVSSYLSKAEAL